MTLMQVGYPRTWSIDQIVRQVVIDWPGWKIAGCHDYGRSHISLVLEKI